MSSATALVRTRGGTSMGARLPIPAAAHTHVAKITQARMRCVASRYCETSTRSASPDATIHQPTAPCSAPKPKIDHSRQRSPGVIHPLIRNQRNGSRNAAPIRRPISRCVHSHQKMVLNSASVMPLLRCWNCGMVLYLSNSAAQAPSLNGGTAPVTGFHSTIERPDSVSRVAPPTSTIAKMSAATAYSHSRIARWRRSIRSMFLVLREAARTIYSEVGRSSYRTTMRIRTRKLIGTIALLVLITAWALLAMAFAQFALRAQSTWVALLFYVIAGLGWVLPAMPIVTWMQRPDRA